MSLTSTIRDGSSHAGRYLVLTPDLTESDNFSDQHRKDGRTGV